MTTPQRAILETGLPIPDRGQVMSRGVRISLTETMKEMRIGNSFVLDDKKDANSARSIASRLKIKVACEKTNEGLRVHRIE